MRTPQYAQNVPGRKVRMRCKGRCMTTRMFGFVEGAEAKNASTTDKAEKYIRVSCLRCGYEDSYFFRDYSEEEI